MQTVPFKNKKYSWRHDKCPKIQRLLGHPQGVPGTEPLPCVVCSADLALIKQRFHRASGIPGILGCIDGTHIQIQMPSEHEYLYVKHEGYHSTFDVQIACDANYNIFNLVALIYPRRRHHPVECIIQGLRGWKSVQGAPQ